MSRFQSITTTILGSVCGFAISAAHGQTTEGEMETITVLGQPSGSFGSAYRLAPEELVKFEHTNIHDVLRNVPGVYVRDEDGHGAFPRISIRGSAGGRSNRIAILEDGIPAAMAPYANPSAYYFPNVNRMSAVEVIKGPETMFHGPQTTGGALNLITTPAPFEGSRTNVRFEIGDYDSLNLHANYGVAVGQWGFLVETYQRDTEGFQKFDRSNNDTGVDLQEYVGKVRWQSPGSSSFRQQFDLKYLYADQISNVSYLGLTDADFRANPDRRYGLSELERMDHGRESLSGRYEIDFTPQSGLAATAYYTDTHRYYTRLNQINGIGIGDTGVTYRINTGAPDADLLQGILDGTIDTPTDGNGVRYGSNDQAFVQKGLQLEYQHGLVTGRVDHHLTLGVRHHEEITKNAVHGLGNITHDQVNGSLALRTIATAVPQQGEAQALSIWVADSISFGKLTLLPVLRYEDYEVKANISHDPTPEEIAGRAINSLTSTTLGLGFNYGLNDQWALIAGVHEGFAPPGTATGDRGDESLNFEGGVRFRRDSFGLDAIAFFSEFTSSIRDCLVANPCSGGIVVGTEDAGAKDVYGLELSLFAELYRSGNYAFPMRLAFTFTDGEYTEDRPGGVQQGDVLEYTPKTIGALQLGVEYRSVWQAYVTLNQTGSACSNNTCDRVGVDPTFLETDSLFTVDISAGYQLSPTTEFYAKVDNVFDERRIMHRGADGARGNPAVYAALGLRMSF